MCEKANARWLLFCIYSTCSLCRETILTLHARPRSLPQISVPLEAAEVHETKGSPGNPNVQVVVEVGAVSGVSPLPMLDILPFCRASMCLPLWLRRFSSLDEKRAHACHHVGRQLEYTGSSCVWMLFVFVWGRTPHRRAERPFRFVYGQQISGSLRSRFPRLFVMHLLLSSTCVDSSHRITYRSFA